MDLLRTKSFKATTTSIIVGSFTTNAKVIIYFKNRQLIYQFIDGDEQCYCLVPFSFIRSISKSQSVTLAIVNLATQPFLFYPGKSLNNLDGLNDPQRLRKKTVFSSNFHSIKFSKEQQCQKFFEAIRLSTVVISDSGPQRQIASLAVLEFSKYYFESGICGDVKIESLRSSGLLEKPKQGTKRKLDESNEPATSSEPDSRATSSEQDSRASPRADERKSLSAASKKQKTDDANHCYKDNLAMVCTNCLFFKLVHSLTTSTWIYMDQIPESISVHKTYTVISPFSGPIAFGLFGPVRKALLQPEGGHRGAV